ncbi:MAG: hypothetical protein AAF573_17075, partial [Bacteroidota bacterium]
INLISKRKRFVNEIKNRIWQDYHSGINELIIKYNHNGFYEITNEGGESFFYRWDKFADVVVTRNIIFLIQKNWEFTYHFSKEEVGEKNYIKINEFLSKEKGITSIELTFPGWFKLLTKFYPL